MFGFLFCVFEMLKGRSLKNDRPFLLIAIYACSGLVDLAFLQLLHQHLHELLHAVR